MKGASPDFNVIWLLQDATVPCPEIFKGLDELLKGHGVVVFNFTVVSIIIGFIGSTV
jgi:hypothetical protein